MALGLILGLGHPMTSGLAQSTPGGNGASGDAAPGAAPVSLVADRVDIDAEAETVTATGNVEVLYGGRVLRARRIVYDQADDEIRATGPIELVDAAGGVVLANEAALTPDLVDGLILNARLLIAGQMQLAAAEVRRTEGRYTTLFRTIASSCEVCPGGAPTWAIRAERVIRDEDALRLYFRNASLEVFGVPVAWLPAMSIPDPTVTRASGFLTPVFRSSGIYGFGLKIPYYHVLGPSADLTVTPFITQDGGSLLELEYRQRFAYGGFDISGTVLPRSPIDDRQWRGAFNAEGFVLLPYGFRAELDVEATSDDRFLEQYDYTSADRLTSSMRVVRSLGHEYFELGAVGFQSLRPEEASEQVPVVFPELTYRRLWYDTPLGGRVGLDIDGAGLTRDEGRDVYHLGGGGDWLRQWQLGPGVLVAASGGAAIDGWRVAEDGVLDDASYGRLVPWTRAELRWPLARAAPGAYHVLEPVVQLVWSDAFGDEEPPNEDSQLPEFDETNLFALNRYPGRDRVETGLRANVGVNYSRYTPAGWRVGVSGGRVFRFADRYQFTPGTGLAGTASDWVAAVSLSHDIGLMALNRIRVSDGFDVERNEFGLTYRTARGAVTAAHVYLAADASNPELGPQPESSEITLETRYRVLRNWEIAGLWRYDFAEDSPIRAGGSVIYGNECAEIDLSLSRRFITSANVEPSTSIGFVVRLTGLGDAGGGNWPRRVCNG